MFRFSEFLAESIFLLSKTLCSSVNYVFHILEFFSVKETFIHANPLEKVNISSTYIRVIVYELWLFWYSDNVVNLPVSESEIRLSVFIPFAVLHRTQAYFTCTTAARIRVSEKTHDHPRVAERRFHDRTAA